MGVISNKLCSVYSAICPYKKTIIWGTEKTIRKDKTSLHFKQTSLSTKKVCLQNSVTLKKKNLHYIKDPKVRSPFKCHLERLQNTVSQYKL